MTLYARIRALPLPWFGGVLAFCAGAALADDLPAVETMPAPLAAEFEIAVSPRLLLPLDAVTSYAIRLHTALEDAGVRIEQPQFVLLVDRSPKVQALLVWWGGTGTAWRLVGAVPVSTGLPGRFEHFLTPLGVFEHSVKNPDFRAEGTKNEFGIRGYGGKGSRVYDFGWVAAPKGWGDGGLSVMRLQMHATDPVQLEPRLGTAQSKGCIRIPASLNEFLDLHCVLDDDYQEELDDGKQLWVLRHDRAPTAWSGRYMVVIDSNATERPAWSPAPGPQRR